MLFICRNPQNTPSCKSVEITQYGSKPTLMQASQIITAMNWACFYTQLIWTSNLSAIREIWKILRTCLYEYTRDMNLSPFGHSKGTPSLLIYIELTSFCNLSLTRTLRVYINWSNSYPPDRQPQSVTTYWHTHTHTADFYIPLL